MNPLLFSFCPIRSFNFGFKVDRFVEVEWKITIYQLDDKKY